jgi:hypothetical protein
MTGTNKILITLMCMHLNDSFNYYFLAGFWNYAYRKTEARKIRSVPLSLFPPQITHGRTWLRARISEVNGL